MAGMIARQNGQARRRMAQCLLALTALSLVAGCGVVGKKKGGPKTPVLGNRVSILTRETGVVVDPALADVAVTVPEAQDNAEWTQPGGNPGKVMVNVAYSGALSRIWSAKVAGSSPQARLAASPVVSNGKLYVIDTQATVHAYDANSGAQLWATDVSEKGNGKSMFGGGVSVFNDRLFATNGVGDVAALDAANGSIVWKQRPGGPLRGSPTVAFGQVYVMSQDNQVFALNQADGALVWQESGTLEATAVFGVAAPAAGQGTVIAGFSSGELSAYRYENGRQIWGDALSRTSIATSVATLTDIDADPVIDRGRVFAIGQGGRMASYELVTGQRIWEITIAGISTPWVAGEWVYVVTDDAKLLCIARSTGKIRWISQLRRFRVEKEKKNKDPVRWTGPVMAGGKLYLVSTLGLLAQVDPANGSIVTEKDMDAPITLRPVVANGTMYVLADNGSLTALK